MVLTNGPLHVHIYGETVYLYVFSYTDVPRANMFSTFMI